VRIKIVLSVCLACALAADESYTNPVMPGDFSDLDAIRAGNEYYAISSTLQYSPGMAVLRSHDLVNWEMAGHVVRDLREISPELNWDHMSRAGRGIWAGSIRYHAGRYWVYFTSPDDGIFVSTATDPAGPWAPLKALLRVAGWDDPCPFWDDDGQGWLVVTRFSVDPVNGRNYNIHLFRMDSSGERLIPGSDRIIHQSRGSEANKLYRFNGLYYHFFSEVHAEGRVGMMERATSLEGPWEIRQLQHVNKAVDKEPNQGGFVQTPEGDWYFVSHQGTGDWEGRAGVLLPVTWIDGWPIIGKPGPDSIGNMVWSGPKPISGFPRTRLAASGDFRAATLRPEWEWNYQPRDDRWSLTERPGALRLHAFPAMRAGDFRSTGNVLTQRSLRTNDNEVTAAFDLSGMADGQEAGLAHFAKTFCSVGVRGRRLSINLNGVRSDGPEVEGSKIWLRSSWDLSGASRFFWSADGREFHSIGEPYQLTWGAYRGDRIGLFTVNDGGDRGFVDVTSFIYRTAP
jgi:beta-xylosidase